MHIFNVQIHIMLIIKQLLALIKSDYSKAVVIPKQYTPYPCARVISIFQKTSFALSQEQLTGIYKFRKMDWDKC